MFSTQFILAVLMKWIITSHRAVVQVGTGWSFVHQFLFKQPLSADLMDDLPSHRCLSFLWFWIRSDHSWCFYCNILHDFSCMTWASYHFNLMTTVDTQGRHLFSAAPWTTSLDTRTLLGSSSCFLYMFKKLISHSAQRDPLKNNSDWVNSALSCVREGAPDCAAPNLNWKPGGNPELLLALPGIQWEEVCKVVHTK